ncbi:hypothetical protein SUGI_0253370 [Cryptomeria japonica]|nr:hypothetical protein SUGI_0253370 [Cryptomeria japonica]
MVVKTTAKSSTERALSNLEKRSPIVKGMRGLEADKAVVPHYQWPTANSSNRAREKFKPLTQSPPPHFSKCRRSLLGLESLDAGRKSSLLGSRTIEKSHVQINGFKPFKSLKKTALKTDALKPSRAHRVEPPFVKQFLASKRTQNSLTAVPDRRHGLSEANSSLKGEIKEQDGCISGSSVSDVGAYDLIEQSSSCQDIYDQSEDTEQCFVLINALGTDCSSQRDSDGLPNMSFSQVNSCPKDEAIEEHDYVSGSGGAEMASKVNTDCHTKQFVGWEDDQSVNGRSDNEITGFDSNECGEVNSSCSGDGNLNCHIQVGEFSVQYSSNTDVDSPQKFSVIESSEGPIHSIQVIKEECIDITGSISDAFDDDYNLISLFAECKDDSSRVSESNFPIKFNIPADVHRPIDNSPPESSISSKFDEGEDVHTLAGGAIETNGADFEEQHLESENTTNEITRMSNECDDHTMDNELINEMRDDSCNISRNSLIGSVPEYEEYESLRSGLKGYKIIFEENKNKLYCLKFRQGRVCSFEYQNLEAEKVDLRYEMAEERKAAHKWMVDYAITNIFKKLYALTNIVKKLSPF